MAERPTPEATFRSLAGQGRWGQTHGVLRRTHRLCRHAGPPRPARARPTWPCAWCRRPARRCRPNWASASRHTSAWTSSTASAPPRCCTSSCPTARPVRYGTTGWPVPGYEIELRGDDGAECADGEPGDLYIHGPSAAHDVLGQPPEDRDTFQGGWTKSGDKYIRNADGTTPTAAAATTCSRSAASTSALRGRGHAGAAPAVLEAAVIGVPTPTA
jgi:benzoate-CoA ligase